MTTDPENVRRMQNVTEGDQPPATPVPETPAVPAAAEPAEPAVPGATPDLNEMTVQELDALAEERGIENYPKSGVKDEKIQALEGR